MSDIQPIVMPKWGLAMQEGTLAKWSAAEGDRSPLGQEIMDIETSKIANVFESPVAGVLRKARRRRTARRAAGRRAARRRRRPRRAGQRRSRPLSPSSRRSSPPRRRTLAARRRADPRRDRRQAHALPRMKPARRCGARRSCSSTASAPTTPPGCSTTWRRPRSAPPMRSTCPAMAARPRRSATARPRRSPTSVSGLIDHLGLKASTSSAIRSARAVAVLVAAGNPGRVASLSLIAPAGIGKADLGRVPRRLPRRGARQEAAAGDRDAGRRSRTS